jgi:three-Cys-motif partner protein
VILKFYSVCLLDWFIVFWNNGEVRANRVVMALMSEPIADGLITPEVGLWAETKYRLFALYDTLFSSGMRHKWNKRIYIDLYAGAGINLIRGTQRLVYGSPLLALTVPHPFDKYIFCEKNTENVEALHQRTKRISPDADVQFIRGDCNAKINEILAGIPWASPHSTVLSLCLVDPYNLGIKFETISRLAERFTDFLVLLALYMDANRNYSIYFDEKSTKMDEFLGDSAWRSEWLRAQTSNSSFPRFVADKYSKRMADLGYLPSPRMKEVRSHEKNLPLYHLAIFSRHQRAYEFWKEVLKYSTDQIDLFED